MLVGDGAAAILHYPDDCTVTLREPGVHPVASQCRPARAAPLAASGSTIALIGAGVLALGALAGGGSSDSPPAPAPPISR